MSSVKVSIIVPLYNKAPYVQRALDSIISQTFSAFEVIVVNDGSTDDGPAIVSNQSDPRIRLVTQSNAGPGPARNRGIAQARGEFIAFLDADDEWLPTYLHESLRLFAEVGSEVASVSSGSFEYPEGNSTEDAWRKRGLTDGSHQVHPNSDPWHVVSMLAYMSPCSTVARTEVIRKWGGFYDREKSTFGEDAYLWLKVLLNEPVLFNLKPQTRFHREASGLSKNLKRARPLEPFLIDPADMFESCPPALHGLLEQVLAIRAAKTACVFGYWGDWRAAKNLMDRFTALKDWRLPYYLPGVVCGTPVGAALGRMLRAVDFAPSA